MGQEKHTKKHLVMKYSDIEKYCTEDEKHQLRNMLIHIAQGRAQDEKKPTNRYLVVNEDEPYYEELYRELLKMQDDPASYSKSNYGDSYDWAEAFKGTFF